MEMKEKTMKSQEKTSRLEDALTNVRTSQQREQFLKQYTEDGYDRFADYLNEYMAEHGDCIGGEQSGHIIFSKYAATGDGLLTAIKLMQAMLANKQPLSVLAAPVKIYPQLLKNVRVADKKTARENPEVQKAVDQVAEALGDEGRILVRESGTEPLIRVMVEAGTDDLCHKYVDSVVDVMEAEGLVVE